MTFPYLEHLQHKAIELAKWLRHAEVKVAHIVWVLVENVEDQDVVRALTFNPYHEYDQERLLSCLKQSLQDTPALTNDGLIESLAFRRILARTERMVGHVGRSQVNGADVLLAILHEQENPATQCLKKCQVTLTDIENYLSQPRFKENNQPQAAADALKSFDIQTLLSPSKTAATTNIHDYLENLNQKYRQGKLPPVIGREKEIQETMMILSQSRKSNPLLVGEPGVGKTTIAVGLAQLIEEQKVPMSLRNSTIYALNLTALMAGTQYRGEFEKRMEEIMNFLKTTPHAILFIDEIHMIIGAGSTKGSDMDIANILKPALASGEISCIGATTYKEFRQIFEKDEALKRRFAEVHVAEPTPEQALAIIDGMKPRLEKHHRVRYETAALEIAVNASRKYIKDRRLPDIALDVLDEAGALVNMQDPHLGSKTVTADDVYRVIANKANIPVAQIAQEKEGSTNLANLSDKLKAAIFGQDHAIETLVSAVTMANAGLRDQNKPIGSFLFAGPTGVGKTELCKQLATELGMKLLRFDMSEYTDAYAYTKLIGTAPGYVGYEQGGVLTEAVQQNPHAIVLMDEIEKAHPQIYNLLLQVLDYGTLTDGQSRKVDFRHTIIVLTTNAGASVLQKRSIGFGEQAPDKSDSNQELARVFTPEFRNRFDEIIQFNALPKSVAGNIVDKLVTELQQTLVEKKVKIILTDAARSWFIEHGYDAYMGARPMGRLVTNELKKPLAKEILYGKLKEGGEVIVDASHDALLFNLSS